jgi:GT2 family glycosyltransferase
LNYAPIVIFAYNRPTELKQTCEALFRCKGIEQHQIIVFCDGAKSESDGIKTGQVLHYLTTIAEDRPIQIVSSEKNQGLARSVIQGVSTVLDKNDAVIVLEDDLVVSPNFLSYMNQALEFYKDDAGVFSISGYSPKIKFPPTYEKDVYFSSRASSWGWATWKDRWETVDWELKSYSKFKKDGPTKHNLSNSRIFPARIYWKITNANNYSIGDCFL